MSLTRTAVIALLPFAAGLAACGETEETETTYEVDATDESGGEFIVTDPDEPAVEVELPETPMTPVPPAETPEPAPTPEETPAE